MRASALIILLFLAGPALSEPALGLWRTEADSKGQVADVRVTQCGASVCGKIVKIYDPGGQSIAHKNVGKPVFWGMTYQGGGTYEGTAFVPAKGREYRGKMTVQGNRLKVSGCAGPVCMSQRWQRIQ